MILHRNDIFYKFINLLNISRNNNIKNKAKTDNKDNDDPNDVHQQAIVMSNYLSEIYYIQFINSIIPIIIETPTLYVIFCAKIIKKFGFKELAKDIISKFEATDYFDSIQQIGLVSDINNFITKYLIYINQLLEYLSINGNQPNAVKTTLQDIDGDNDNNDNDKIPTRSTLKMNDSEILLVCKNVLNDLIEIINYFDDDEVIEYLSSVIPPKNDDDDDDNDDRLGLKYYRCVCYTNLASIAMIEQDFENVIEYSVIGLDNNCRHIQLHRYLIAGLIASLHSYKTTDKNQNDNNIQSIINDIKDNDNDDNKTHFHPTKNSVKTALDLMLKLDNKHPFAVKVQEFIIQYTKLEKNNNNNNINYAINSYLNMLNCTRRIYGRYSISPAKYKPKQRCLHSINTVNNHSLIMFGGMTYKKIYNNNKDNNNNITVYNDIWILDTNDNSWKYIIPYGGLPSGRFSHSSYLISNNSLLMIIGGKINCNLHILPSNKEYRLYNDHHDLRYSNNNNMDDDNNIDVGGWTQNNLETNGLVHNLLNDNQYNLCDIYDINNNIWYSPIKHTGQYPPFNYLCDHISIQYSNKIYIFPIGSKLMYIIDLNKSFKKNKMKNKKKHKKQLQHPLKITNMHWERVELSISSVIASQSTLMISSVGNIILSSIWKYSHKSSMRSIITINPHTYQCVHIKQLKDDKNSINIFDHSIQYFGEYNNTIYIKNISKNNDMIPYDCILTHGGLWIDKLQTMTIPQIFDCNGNIHNELLLNPTNKIMLIASNNNNSDLMYIGNRLELSDFIDIPRLYGHRMTKVGNNLIITGGIGISNRYNDNNTFCYVIQYIDKIIQNAIINYKNNIKTKYNIAIKSSFYTKNNSNKISSNNSKKSLNKSSKHQHSNSRYIKKQNKNKGKYKGNKGKNKNKNKKKIKNKHHHNYNNQKQKNKNKKNNNNNDLLIRQNNIRSSVDFAVSDNNVLRDVIKSTSLEAIKLKTSCLNANNDDIINNGIKWILDIRYCDFCESIELYSTQNIKKIKNNNNETIYFCSNICQIGYQQRENAIKHSSHSSHSHTQSHCHSHSHSHTHTHDDAAE